LALIKLTAFSPAAATRGASGGIAPARPRQADRLQRLMLPAIRNLQPSAADPRLSAGGLGKIVVLSLLLAAVPMHAAVSGVSEYEVKTAALFNILSFVEWPSASFDSADDPLVIGVLGRGPVSDLLEKQAALEQWQNRPIMVKRYATPAEVKDCHVLYVDRSSHERWPSIRSLFTGRPILTVSDAEKFAREFGIVQLDIERNKLRLVVNIGAARISGVKISSKVLRLAEVIGEQNE
jgi:hypothetical protein